MTTFVVKVTADSSGGLHGTVSRVAGGETQTFAGSAQLVALLEEWTASEGVWAATSDGSGSPVRTND